MGSSLSADAGSSAGSGLVLGSGVVAGSSLSVGTGLGLVANGMGGGKSGHMMFAPDGADGADAAGVLGWSTAKPASGLGKSIKSKSSAALGLACNGVGLLSASSSNWRREAFGVGAPRGGTFGVVAFGVIAFGEVAFEIVALGKGLFGTVVLSPGALEVTGLDAGAFGVGPFGAAMLSAGVFEVTALGAGAFGVAGLGEGTGVAATSACVLSKLGKVALGEDVLGKAAFFAPGGAEAFLTELAKAGFPGFFQLGGLSPWFIQGCLLFRLNIRSSASIASISCSRKV